MGTLITRRLLSLIALIAIPAQAQTVMPGNRERGVSRFRAGTTLTFYQPAPQVGWIRISTFDDAALRIVGSATPSSGGTNGFSTVMAQTTVGNFTITIGELPSHSHTATAPNLYDVTEAGSSNIARFPFTETSSSAGSGGAHNHTLTMDMKYVDALVASKA